MEDKKEQRQAQYPDRLIEILDTYRIEKGISNNKFALEVLGIAPDAWSRFKKGIRKVTDSFTVRAFQRIPEKRFEIGQYMEQKGIKK